MHALDRRDLRDAARLKPGEEFRRGARVGAARVRIPDLRGEEFEEAIGGLLAAAGDGSGNTIGDKGVCHLFTPSRRFQSLGLPTPGTQGLFLVLSAPHFATAKAKSGMVFGRLITGC